VSFQEPTLGVEAEPNAVHRPNWDVNRVTAGDCLEQLRDVPAASVHLVLCDLPYGTTNNDWDSVIPLPELWAHYRRVLHPQGVVVLTGQGPFSARLVLSNEAWYKYTVCWIKSKATNFLNAKKQPLRRHEDICVFAAGAGTYLPQMQPGAAYDKGVRKAQQTGSYNDMQPAHVRTAGGRYPTDVVYFKTAESEGPVWHPTQKPVGLGRYLVRTYSRPGEVVLDNACGSGSFLVAALAEGRNYVGIELNAHTRQFKQGPVDLVAVAQQRLAATLATLPDRQRAWITPAAPR